MSIKLNRYVDITSGVGAGENVGDRQLIGRFFTENTLVPTGGQVEFTNADDVEIYFGSNSTEYARAVFYFGWVSKNITAPQLISFARWANAATAPQIFGAPGPQSLSSYTSITAGSFTLTLGGVTNTLSGLNFSSDASLAAVAATLQTAIRAETGTMWTAATVNYDATRSCFDFTGGVTGTANVIVVAGTGGSDVASQLGWLSPATILSNGSAIQTITQVLDGLANSDNNFGSFAFIPALDQAQIVEAATWNDAQNNMFMYSVPCIASAASALSAALLDIGGVTLTLAPLTTEFPEQVPMMILAATDYTALNAVQNYEFQVFNLTASVLTDTDADTYDGLRINYYGQTQTAGQLIQFYQQGLMMGLPVDPLDQNTYANEIWLKDAAGAAIMTVLLALPQLPANNAGVAQLTAILQGVINQALANGTILPGKTLSTTQQLYITQITGDPLAWRKVQTNGYWVDVVIEPYVVDDVTKYKAVYTLVYSKDDVIRLVEGRDILI